MSGFCESQFFHPGRRFIACGCSKRCARFDTSGTISYHSIMRNFPLVAIFAALLSFQLAAAEAPKTFKVGEFTFTRPADWQWVADISPMRKAQLKVTGADKSQAAEVVFFYFGEGNGGGTKANVDRWLGQFQDKSNQKVEDVKAGKHTVTYVQVEGTYMSGMPGGPRTPQPNSALLGAIIESAEGNVFIKMTGPIAVVKSSKDTFKRMVEDPLK